MPSLIRKKITREIYATQTTRNTTVGYKKRCSVGSLTRPSCTNFSTKCRAELNNYIAKKHSKTTARVVHKCKKTDRLSQL